MLSTGRRGNPSSFQKAMHPFQYLNSVDGKILQMEQNSGIDLLPVCYFVKYVFIISRDEGKSLGTIIVDFGVCFNTVAQYLVKLGKYE